MVSIVGSVLVTLSGVVAGAVLANRSQKQHKTRDRQIDACAAVVAESTRAQVAIRRAWKEGGAVDWTAWNIALGTVSLVGEPPMVTAAARMDEVFWRHSNQFIRGVTHDERAWDRARDLMEAARLEFINVARGILDAGQPMTEAPVRRPPLPDPSEPSSGGG
ncbi:hypothetical protein [Streptomyces sp. SP17KL33]|uniref:hypothetical protein n=1 Tax=Streptomyces sp. SP17KL33 TaxID=3002534 RepID=UPI002E76DD61|nr:hypothetical protein [Streptomyces sp. SP17KL33]MEE1831016.1 hypothetical protein [Streptomyces sp. SP17KL33]